MENWKAKNSFSENCIQSAELIWNNEKLWARTQGLWEEGKDFYPGPASWGSTLKRQDQNKTSTIFHYEKELLNLLIFLTCRPKPIQMSDLLLTQGAHFFYRTPRSNFFRRPRKHLTYLCYPIMILFFFSIWIRIPIENLSHTRTRAIFSLTTVPSLQVTLIKVWQQG